MESLQMNKTDVELMSKICFPQSNMSRRHKEIDRICSIIVDKCQASQSIANRDNGLITILVFPSEGTKDAPECDADNIFACLLFALLRKRSINVQFLTGTKKMQSRNNENFIRMNVGKISSKQYRNTQFFKKVTALLQNQRKNLLKFHSHFKSVSFKCRTEDVSIFTGLREVIALSRSSIKFISRYLVQLLAFFPNDPLHINRLTIDGFDNSAALESLPDQQWMIFEEMEMKSILKSASQIFCRTLVLRLNRISLFKFYSHQNLKKKKENLHFESGDSDLQQRFEGNSLQYLEKLMVCFSIYDDKSVLLNIFPFLTNISHFYLEKSKQIIQLEAQSLLKVFAIHNNLLKLLTFKNIQQQVIRSSVIMSIYEQCPFLSEIEGLVRFRFAFEDTYISTDPRQRDEKEQDRKCQLILRAMLLRNISINMKTDIIKLMLHDGYDFNTALEVVQSVENVCF